MTDHRFMPRASVIAWLLRERFFEGSAEDLLSGLNSAASGDVGSAVSDYREELEALPEEELRELGRAKVQDTVERMRREKEAEQAEKFFNVPVVFADYTFWSRLMLWTIEQVTSLSLGRDPDKVNAEAFTLWGGRETAFGREYFARLRLLRFSASVGQVSDPTTPGEALAMLDRLKLDYPPELLAAVEAQGVQVRDWRSLYYAAFSENEQLSTYNDQWETAYHALEAEYADQSADNQNQITLLEDRCTNLALEVEGMRANKLAQSQSHDPPRRSDEKMLLAIAIRKFHFKTDAKNSAAKNIADLCAEEGLPVSDRTVRDRLHAIAEKRRNGEWN